MEKDLSIGPEWVEITVLIYIYILFRRVSFRPAPFRTAQALAKRKPGLKGDLEEVRIKLRHAGIIPKLF